MWMPARPRSCCYFPTTVSQPKSACSCTWKDICCWQGLSWSLLFDFHTEPGPHSNRLINTGGAGVSISKGKLCFAWSRPPSHVVEVELLGSPPFGGSWCDTWSATEKSRPLNPRARRPAPSLASHHPLWASFVRSAVSFPQDVDTDTAASTDRQMTGELWHCDDTMAG